MIYNDYDVAEQMTRPPARIGEAKLLGLMEYAGKILQKMRSYWRLCGAKVSVHRLPVRI